MVLLDSQHLPDNLQTSKFLHQTTTQLSSVSKKRRRRSDSSNDIKNNDVKIEQQESQKLPDSYIAGFFRNDQLPTVFELGNGSQHGNIVNQPLIKGKYYTTFIRAFVRAVRKFQFVAGEQYCENLVLKLIRHLLRSQKLRTSLKENFNS